MGMDRPLRLARGPGGVDDQRIVARPASRVGDGLGAGCDAGQLVDAEEGRPGTERIRPLAVADGQHGTGVGDDMIDLGAGGRRADRHEDRTGAHDAEEGRDGGQRGACAPQHAVARDDAPLGQGGRRRRRARVEGRRVHPVRAVPPVDQHRRLGVGRPAPGPHLRERPARRRRPAVGPAAGGDERLHHRRAEVIVWRS